MREELRLKREVRFKKLATKRHNGKYNYDFVYFTNNTSYVYITCPAHGVFLQQPCAHLKGCGCPHCNGNAKLDRDIFIRRSKEAHGNKYSYSRFVFKGTKEPSIITCPVHGDFLQKPCDHMGGSGCPKCAREASSKEKIKRSLEKYTSKAKAIHGDKYLYDRVVYTGARAKISIGCRNCGKYFEQAAHLHLQGCGCPNCSGKELHTLYILADSLSNPCKIKVGVTKDLAVRMRFLRKDTPFEIFVWKTYGGDGESSKHDLEQEVHRKFAALNCGYTGFDGATEWFWYDPVIIEFVEMKLCLEKQKGNSRKVR